MSDLVVLFLLPFVLPVVLWFPIKYCHRIALGISSLPLALLLFHHSHWVGAEVDTAWIPALSIRFHLLIDSLSLFFLYFTALIIPVSVASAQGTPPTCPRLFYSLIFLLEGLLFGFFMARDLMLFTLFWEAMLFPLYFLLLIWGGGQRQRAALTFLLYMIAGSCLLVAAVLSLYVVSGTFDLNVLTAVAGGAPHASWIFAIFLLAFAVKTPLFPFHAWLPITYQEAPVAGTILLAALLSKAGVYGLLRIGMEGFPFLFKEWSPLLLGLGIAGVVYGGMAAWAQRDVKRLIAYSSFSHVNFILAGLFVGEPLAWTGAILQVLNHGVTISALFLVAEWLKERIFSTALGDFDGLAALFPKLCWLTLFFVLSAIALPGMNNFVGEFLILLGLFFQNPWLTPILGASTILSAIYMLRWMEKVYFGKPSFERIVAQDLTGKELALALPLVILILWTGIYPAPILAGIKQIVELSQ
jgi:NADH-quinone oxidoreductase subunit M